MSINNKVPTAVSYSLDTVDVYDYNYKNHGIGEECLYTIYRDLYMGNMFTWFFVNHLVDLIMGNIVFKSSLMDDEKFKRLITMFDKKHEFKKNLRQVLTQSIVYGNGFFYINNDKKIFKRLDSENIIIHRNKYGVKTYEIKDKNIESSKTVPFASIEKLSVDDLKQKSDILSDENVKHLTLFDIPESPYGVSLLRPNIQDFRALKSLSRYSYTGIAHLSCVDRYMSLDLDGLSEEEVKNAMNTAMESFKQLVSSTQTITFFDKNNDIYYGGTKNGGATQRIQPFRDIIETPLGVLMSQFCMSMGFLLPSGANKSIIQETEKKIRYTLNRFRGIFVDYIEKILYEIFPDVGLLTVFIEDPNIEPMVERTFSQTDVSLGIISKEEYREKYYPSLNRNAPKDEEYVEQSAGKLGYESYKPPSGNKGSNNHADGEE